MNTGYTVKQWLIMYHSNFFNYVLYTMIKIPCASFWSSFACWTYRRPLLILSPNNNYNALKVCFFFVACLKILYHTVFENKSFLLFIRKVALVRKAIFAWKSFATSYSGWKSSQYIFCEFSVVRKTILPENLLPHHLRK